MQNKKNQIICYPNTMQETFVEFAAITQVTMGEMWERNIWLGQDITGIGIGRYKMVQWGMGNFRLFYNRSSTRNCPTVSTSIFNPLLIRAFQWWLPNLHHLRLHFYRWFSLLLTITHPVNFVGGNWRIGGKSTQYFAYFFSLREPVRTPYQLNVISASQA